MQKFTLIILAGGEKGPLYETTRQKEKALIEIHGRTMLDRVVDAFDECELIKDIVVVGSHNLDHLPCKKKIRRRMFTGVNLMQNLMHAVAYVKNRVYRGASEHRGYVISFCDAVFLTPDVINDTLKAIDAAEADIVLHYVEKSSFEAAGLPAERTYIPIDGKQYTGSTIYYVKKFSKVFAFMNKLQEMRKHRKDPLGILKILGCENESLSGIEKVLSSELGVKVKLLVSPHPELGMDVDKPKDLELAERLLGE